MVDNAYIALIKFIDEKSRRTGVCSAADIQLYMREKHPGYHEQTLGHMIAQVAPGKVVNGQHHQMLSSDAYFHLLEHEELQEARDSSKAAMSMATKALVVAIVVGIASIGLQIYQIITPTNVLIDVRQIETIKSTIRDNDAEL